MPDYPPLADSADYAQLIGVAPPGVDVDRLCVAASGKVRAYCGWVIGPEIPEVLTVNGSGSYRQFLPTMHLTGVTSVTDTGVALDMTQLDWAGEGWVEWTQGSWGYPRIYGNPGDFTASTAYPGMFSRRPRGVVAAVTHGYDEVPAEVVMLVCTMVARQAASPAGVVREQAGQRLAQYSQAAPNVAGGLVLMRHEMGDLDTYRIPRVR